jgi:hypothetical protein
MKAEGREKANEDNDDDDDEEDEDFEAGSDSGDDDLEYDSNVSVASDSDEDDGSAAGSPEKKLKTSPKKSSKKALPTKSKSTKKLVSISKAQVCFIFQKSHSQVLATGNYEKDGRCKSKVDKPNGIQIERVC